MLIRWVFLVAISFGSIYGLAFATTYVLVQSEIEDERHRMQNDTLRLVMLTNIQSEMETAAASALQPPQVASTR